MRAAIINQFGRANNLMVKELDKPNCKDNQLLIKVCATSINPMDCKIRKYGFKEETGIKFPLVLGIDVAGEIVEVGKNITEYSLGDKVFGYIDMLRMGGYAEYCIVLPHEVEKMPSNMSFVEAASLPVVGITAFMAIFGFTKIKASQKVLIHAAAGGVGTIAVQLAKYLNAYVIATASLNNHAFLKELGADEVIDYNSTNFSEKLENIDVVIDAVGGNTQESSFKTLKEEGWLISITSPPSENLKKEYKVNTGFVYAMPNKNCLNKICKLYEAGYLKPIISKVFSLDQINIAHQKSEENHVRGKIVIKL